MPFEIGDLVRPSLSHKYKRKKSKSIGVVTEVTKLDNYDDSYCYTVQFITSDVCSVGWTENNLERIDAA